MSTYHTGDEAKYDVRIGFGFDVTQSRLNTSTLYEVHRSDQIRSDEGLPRFSESDFGVGWFMTVDSS